MAGAAPSTAVQRGGTTAVTAARKRAQHEKYVQGLSGEEHDTYQAGARRAQARQVGSLLTGGAAPVETGAAFVLGLLFWGWVALPFLKAGPARGPAAVRDVLRAKFFNQAADRSWLP